MNHISIVTPCYNEEGNVCALYEAVKKIFAGLGTYTYEHIFIDNCSRDRTPAILRELAAKDENVKVILNARNFGHIRSPYHAILQSTGDAVMGLVADFQDPPELIPEFLRRWEEGYKVVVGVKAESDETPAMFFVRKLYYRLVSKLADVELVKDFTGFGLYDRKVIDILRSIDDPYPYFRGLIADIGFTSFKIPYRQPTRQRGITKNNFFTLYDLAMLGIINYSKLPLRLATMVGFAMGACSLLAALGYLATKLLAWDHFIAGIAPLIIALFFFSSVQLFFLGLLGEYVAAILTHIRKKPLVIESERINFTCRTTGRSAA